MWIRSAVSVASASGPLPVLAGWGAGCFSFPLPIRWGAHVLWWSGQRGEITGPGADCRLQPVDPFASPCRVFPARRDETPLYPASELRRDQKT